MKPRLEGNQTLTGNQYRKPAESEMRDDTCKLKYLASHFHEDAFIAPWIGGRIGESWKCFNSSKAERKWEK